jgi:hypothetical protein
MGKFIKNLVVFAGIVLALGFIWDFFTAAPSTKSVCYTWSKATDPYLPFDEGGIDGAQWLADNLKTEEDLVSIDKDVLSAMRLYESGSFLDDVDDGDRLGLRQFVIDACEKVEPGSTDH